MKRECMTCGNEYDEDEMEYIEDNEITMTSGYICNDCADADVSDVFPETPLDLSDYKTARGAAEATRDFLQEWSSGGSEEVTLHEKDGWFKVIWSSGPFEWSLKLTGGESMYSGEYESSTPGNPEIVGFFDNPNWEVEAEGRQSLGFYNS